MPNPRKPRSNCLVCGIENSESRSKYCSNKCQMEYQHRCYIQRWKEGKETGLIAIGVVSVHVKRYLREKFGNKCSVCGWAEVNETTGLVPVVADHIDGNWRNNLEENLRLLCPNCDSLTATYAALNKGKGRSNRRISKRSREASTVYRTVSRKNQKV